MLIYIMILIIKYLIIIFIPLYQKYPLLLYIFYYAVDTFSELIRQTGVKLKTEINVMWSPF